MLQVRNNFNFEQFYKSENLYKSEQFFKYKQFYMCNFFASLKILRSRKILQFRKKYTSPNFFSTNFSRWAKFLGGQILREKLFRKSFLENYLVKILLCLYLGTIFGFGKMFGFYKKKVVMEN